MKLKTYLHKAFKALLIISLPLFFTATLQAFYQMKNAHYYNGRPNLDPQHCNTVYPRNHFESTSSVAAVDLRIEKVIQENDDVRFMGKISVMPDFRNENRFLTEDMKLVVQLDGAKKVNIFMDIPQTVELIQIDKKKTPLYWESEEFEIFDVYGSRFKFPFDRQFLALSMSLEYFDSAKDKYIEIEDVQTTVNMTLPKEYETFGDYSGVEFQNYLNQRELERKIFDGDNHICVVQTAQWLKWLVMFLIAFLTLPIWLVLNKKSPFSSMDFISVLLSIFTVRTLLIGNLYETSIYALDGVFLTYLFWLAMIPLWPSIEKTIFEACKRVRYWW